LLLEKAQLTHGSTWHAAGLIGQLRSKRNLTRLMQNSVALYRTLERDTGQAIDWHEVGSVRLASSAERWSELKRAATTARGFNFEMELISPKEAQDRFPYITLDGIAGAAWVPSDGYVDPSSLTQALAKGARAGGVKILQATRVTGFESKDKRITKVLTDKGAITCETVVIAAGIWSRAVGKLMGVHIPAAALEHQYMVTEPLKEARDRRLPTLRDPDKNFYLKPEVGGFAVGGWEMGTPSFHASGVPFDFAQELLPPNMDRFEEIALATAERIPVFGELGLKQLINGPIPVSPDGEPIMGQATERDNVFVACGFTSGIAAAGGAGRAMAEWIVQGYPEMDLWPFDLRRFGDFHCGTRALHERAVHAYGSYYHLHYPGEELTVARDARRSPLWQTLKERGAVYGSKFGWERPNWFASGEKRIDEPSFEGKPNWFEPVAAEHRAVRERVGLFDLSSFTKFEVSGRGAFDSLQRVVANDLDKPDGSVVYTQLCNERGGIEADLTVVRLAADHFYVVTGSGFAVRDGHWLRQNGVELKEITSSRAVVNVQGPRSRELLQRVCEDDVSNAAFPYLAARTIRVGFAPLLALRVTYAGELGWELHVPSEYALHLYETLWDAGQDLGVANAGYRALDSLRLEKGYRYWSSELSPDTNPYEVGLGFAVALEKGDFIGRVALQRAKGSVKRKLACFLMDGFVPLHGGEAILHEGKVIETVTSGGYGHSIGKSIAYGFVPVDLLKKPNFEVESFGVRHAARISERAPYDPDRKKVVA
jgi:4-methylaminobutanoate oxidase (formaldehyde-forming)